MKKNLLLLITLIVSKFMLAQVAVTITNPINTTPNLSSSYTSLAAAITDLNSITTISGPVTLTCASGSETAPVGGYIINFTAATTLANNVTISGTATTTITAFSPQTTSSLIDAIFKIVGSDFVTIQNFTMQENGSNTLTAAATNNMTEFGVALFYASTTNGAQNNIIQNNTISLNRSYSNTFGIYSNTRHTSTNVNNTADIIASTGANSNNKVYGNAINNVNCGIVFVGSSTAANMDSGNDVGGSSVSTGNIITNWGGCVSGTISTYVSVSTNCLCIYTNHQVNDNVSFNTVISATNITTLLIKAFYGIYKSYSAGQPTGLTFTSNYNNNTVTLTNSPTSSQMIGMALQGLQSLSTATINCNNNNIIDCAVKGASAASAAIYGMFHVSAPGTFNINGNTFRGFTTTSTGSSPFTAIQLSASSIGVVNALNINNNKFGDTTSGLITFIATPVSGIVSAITVNTTAAASTCALSITGNDIRGIVYSLGGTGANNYIWNSAPALTQNISSNTFTNLSVNTTGNITLIVNNGSLPTGGLYIANSNSIVTGFRKIGVGGSMSIHTASPSVASATTAKKTAQNNNFSNITCTGATSMSGWSDADGVAAGLTKNFSNNTFSNWSCGSNPVTVINLSNNIGTSAISSNTISNITGSGGIIGIYLSSNSLAIAVHSNTITGLSSSSTSSAVTGINCQSITADIFKNKVYDLTNSSAFTVTGLVNGILLSGSAASSTINVYNNLIGDLKAGLANSTGAIWGISINSLAALSTYNVYYNSIYLDATSSGANFGTAGIYHVASFDSTVAMLNLRNNVIVNNSTSNGTGLAVAYFRSNTNLANYGSTSNNNCFYGSSIFTDGTNTDVTLANYKTRVSTRDAASISENPTFLSTSGISSNFLKFNLRTSTLLESGGANIATYTEDYFGTIRAGNPGSLSFGNAPDIGAYESIANQWVGATSDWSTTSNWSNNSLPINGDDVIITSGYTNPMLVGNLSIKNLALQTGTIMGIGSNTLTITGFINGNGFLGGGPNSNLTIGASAGTILFDQSNLGSSNMLKNLSLNSGSSLTLGNLLNISSGAQFGVVSVGLGATLTTKGYLTLKSSPLGTAAIGVSTGTIIGNITMERFISASGRRWRYLSAPVTGQTLADWGTKFYITGPGTPGATVGSPNSNGYATSRSNLLGFNNATSTPSSVRIYNRTDSGSVENGWSNPPLNMGSSLQPGVGYRAYVRGPITGNYAQDTVVIGFFNTNLAPPNQASFVFSQTGGVINGVNAGDVNLPINSTGTGASGAFNTNTDGWNFLGNPYPCAFNWDAFWNSNSNITNISPAIYIFDAITNSYKTYSAQTGAGTLTNGIIPASTAFFVKATDIGASLTLNEAFKITSNAPIELHKKSMLDELHIKYYKDSTESDEYILKMMENATLQKDDYDIAKLKNDNLNLSSYGIDSINLTLSSIPYVSSETKIKLNVEATQIGTYHFDFANLATFQSNISIQLYDRYKNKTIDVRKNNKYAFEMGPDSNQWGKNRFELILNNAKTGDDEKANAILNTTMKVYPNPATEVLNISLNNVNIQHSKVKIYNVSGIEVLENEMTDNKTQINIGHLSSGLYFVRVINENGFDKTEKFMK